jgi:hypothetical protein
MVGNEGFSRKEINVLMEGETHIFVYHLKIMIVKKIPFFQFILKFSFDKQSLNIDFMEKIKYLTMMSIGADENIYLLTKDDGTCQIITEAKAESKKKKSRGVKGMRNKYGSVVPGLQQDEPSQDPEEEEEEYDSEDEEGGRDAEKEIKPIRIY